MGKGCALLEFETVEEAKRVLAAGVRVVGGIQLGLELWSPSFGCFAEDGDRKEAWVRILGFPISLWVPSVLRRVGEECGGFLGIDPLTERKEELEWARVQVKMNGGALPRSLEIGVEGEIYIVSLWWEILPAIRKEQGGGDVIENWTHNGRVGRQSYGPLGDGSCSSGSGFGIVGLKRDFGPDT